MPAIIDGSKAELLYRLLAQHDYWCAERFRTLFTTASIRLVNRSDIEVLNVFWREQLMALGGNTITERECLCQSHDFNAWLDNFRTYVLPTVLLNHLPREY